MSSTQDFICVFCSETFEEKESLQEHFRKHGDPKFNSVTKNKSRFETEQPLGSDKPEENEMVGCDVCEETFKTISKAITHKHKVHPDHDAKYFCPWCGKLFTMKHLYNKHMQSSHTNMVKTDESVYHCDSCSVDFFLPSAMLYHNKFFHRQDTELPAIGHSKKVKTCNQEMLQIYYCPFCGEEYNNKVNLHKHMADDHSDENQSPEEVLRCPLCDAVFYHLDAYELHLSFHSSDDIYSDDNEMAAGITDFSLESVPPVMEKVEEETKNEENEGIDKFLQLIMDESRESGNNEGLDRPKSKKHKKHKKSKKAAITLDEFLNMNKDVFGDGLDVQGIEEIPTQQVLKKYRVRKDNIAKAVPASAIAKLKKQGITVKSNSGPNSSIFKGNQNLIIKRTNVTPNLLMAKPKPVTNSDELLSKLLNQGNSQIKIVKKSSQDSLNKEKLENSAVIEEPTSSNTKQLDFDNDAPSPKNDAKLNNGNEDHEMEHETTDVHDNKVNDEDTVNHSDNSNDTDKEDQANSPLQKSVDTTVNNDDIFSPKAYNNSDNDPIKKPESSKVISETSDYVENQQHESDMRVSDDNDNLENNGDDIDRNASDGEDIPSPSQNNSKNCNETLQEAVQRNKSLDALKRLSSLITIKPTSSPDNKSDGKEAGKLNEQKETDAVDNNKQSNVAKIVGNNTQNILKKPIIPQKKIDTSTKPIDALKTLNKQLTISPCITSTTKCNDESEDDEPDVDNMMDDSDNSNVNICNENDNGTFKTPMSVTKPTPKSSSLLNPKAPINVKSVTKPCITEEDNPKNTFNMDILKRLTNVTAKPIARTCNSPPIKNNQAVESKTPVVQKIEKNKEIDKDIEIFNIDDSDSDQDLPDEESVDKQTVNTTTNIETKTIDSAHVLKNLSKNIIVKSTNVSHKNITNVKREIPSDNSKIKSEGDLHTSSTSEIKHMSQNKQVNINLNNTLKKLGGNISIKSQYSSPEPHRYQMLDDEDVDDNFDMNDDASDPENTTQLKITEMPEEEEGIHSDTECNENVTVQSPHGSNSENEETHNFQSDEEENDDIEEHIKSSTLSKTNTSSTCLDNFKKNNKQLTIKSLGDKNTFSPQIGSPNKRLEEAMRPPPSKASKDMSGKQLRPVEKQDDDNEVVTKNITHNQSAATTSSQKVSNQVNTVKTVKTFQSETIIEEVTTTVTKTIRTVNQSSKQFARNANITTYRPRLTVPNQMKPLQGVTVRNAPTVGTKIRNAATSIRPSVVPSKSIGQLVPIRPQNQIVPRQQGAFRPNAPGPSNVRRILPQQSVQKPVIGKPLKISPLAMNQTVKRVPENASGTFSGFKKPRDVMMPSMDSFDDDNDESMINYSSTSSCRSDFSTTATKIVKGKAVMTATQARSEQHSEQHISKLNNMAGLKIVRTSAKQASQSETKNMCAAKRTTTMDAIEKLQKQGLLIKKPRIEEPEENEEYNSDGGGGEEDYDDNE